MLMPCGRVRSPLCTGALLRLWPLPPLRGLTFQHANVFNRPPSVRMKRHVRIALVELIQFLADWWSWDRHILSTQILEMWFEHKLGCLRLSWMSIVNRLLTRHVLLETNCDHQHIEHAASSIQQLPTTTANSRFGSKVVLRAASQTNGLLWR